MTNNNQTVTIHATREELDGLYMRRAETDAKGIAQLLGLTVQRVYQLEKEDVIARTVSGNYNIADTLAAYIHYKNTGKILPPSVKLSGENGFSMEVTEETQVTTAQLAAILGTTPTLIDRLAQSGTIQAPEHINGIAEDLQLDMIAKLPLHSILQAHGETEEAIETAERKRRAYIAAVHTADHMKPSDSKWELFAIQDSLNAFLEALPIDISREAKGEM